MPTHSRGVQGDWQSVPITLKGDSAREVGPGREQGYGGLEDSEIRRPFIYRCPSSTTVGIPIGHSRWWFDISTLGRAEQEAGERQMVSGNNWSW